MREIVENEGGVVSRTVISDDGVIERRVQDVQPILDTNTRIANSSTGYTPSKDLKFVARIPLIVIEQWKKEGVDIYDPNCEEEIMRRLNNGDWARLRTSGGRL